MSEEQKPGSTLQDISVASSQGEGGTPSTEPETFTKEQVEKLVTDAKNEVGGVWGRKFNEAESRANKAQGELDRANARMGEIEGTLANLRAEALKKELEAAQGNPEASSLIQLRHQIAEQEHNLKKERQQIDRDKVQIAEDKKVMAAFIQKQTATEIAGRYESGSADTLISITDGSSEKMEAAAKALWKLKSPAPGTSVGSGTEEIHSANLEGSRGSGGYNPAKTEGMTIISSSGK